MLELREAAGADEAEQAHVETAHEPARHRGEHGAKLGEAAHEDHRARARLHNGARANLGDAERADVLAVRGGAVAGADEAAENETPPTRATAAALRTSFRRPATEGTASTRALLLRGRAR